MIKKKSHIPITNFSLVNFQKYLEIPTTHCSIYIQHHQKHITFREQQKKYTKQKYIHIAYMRLDNTDHKRLEVSQLWIFPKACKNNNYGLNA